jgi:Tfp pilus assembly protein PilN
MIKINLLGERRTGKTRKGRLGAPPPEAGVATGGGGAGWQNLVLVLIFLASLGVVGGWAWMLVREQEEKETERARLEERLRELEKEKLLFEQLQAKKAAKERRVAMLRELKENKHVPVYVLQQVNDALGAINQGEVQSLWLESLSEDKQHLNLSGRASTFNDVSELWNALNGNPVFADVTLGQTIKERDNIRFSLDATIEPEFADYGEEASVAATAGASAQE